MASPPGSDSYSYAPSSWRAVVSEFDVIYALLGGVELSDCAKQVLAEIPGTDEDVVEEGP